MNHAHPEVLLLRNVLATTAHDLGGLASALLLRADVLEHGPSDATVRAMRSIAGELRELGQQLRALRNDDGSDTLAPSQNRSRLQWSARVTRFGSGLLPRGSAIDCTVDDTRIPHPLSHPLWNVSLALLGAIGEHRPETRLTVHIGSTLRPQGTALTFGATANGRPLEISDAMHGAWWEWALLHAEQHQITLVAESAQVVVATHSARPS